MLNTVLSFDPWYNTMHEVSTGSFIPSTQAFIQYVGPVTVRGLGNTAGMEQMSLCPQEADMLLSHILVSQNPFT